VNASGNILSGLLLSALVLMAGRAEATEIPVVINEFLASNTEYMADPQGQYDDWVELHNPGDVPFDVGGLYLTDNLSSPAKWQIPTDVPTLTTIPAGGFLVIWADDDLADPGLHAPFFLSAAGEDLALVDVNGVTLIDRISSGQQTSDVSYGRFPDGTDTWSQMMFPTPRGGRGRILLRQRSQRCASTRREPPRDSCGEHVEHKFGLRYPGFFGSGREHGPSRWRRL